MQVETLISRLDALVDAGASFESVLETAVKGVHQLNTRFDWTGIYELFPDNVLRLALASVLFLSGLKLLNVPEANWVLAGGLIAAVVGFGVWALLQRPSASRQPAVPAELSD